MKKLTLALIAAALLATGCSSYEVRKKGDQRLEEMDKIGVMIDSAEHRFCRGPLKSFSVDNSQLLITCKDEARYSIRLP